MARPVPDGFNTVSAYLVVRDADLALEFYARAFGAEPGTKLLAPDGKSTMHAEMRIGNSTVMLTQVNPEWGLKDPAGYGGSPVTMHIYVEDADALYERAVAAGCEVKFTISDIFWGDRYGKLADPFGHEWGIATHVEDLSEEEISRRQAEYFASLAQAREKGSQ